MPVLGMETGSPGRETGLIAMVKHDTNTSARNLIHERILATVDAIPRGCVATYGQIATEAGVPGRARLVGRLLRELPSGSDLPWYRVINSAGRSSLDPASRSGRAQKKLLRSEGVEISTQGRVDLRRFQWKTD